MAVEGLLGVERLHELMEQTAGLIGQAEGLWVV